MSCWTVRLRKAAADTLLHTITIEPNKAAAYAQRDSMVHMSQPMGEQQVCWRLAVAGQLLFVRVVLLDPVASIA